MEGGGWGVYKLTAAQKNTFDISIRSRSRLRRSHPPKSTKQTNKRMNPTDDAYDTHSFGCRVGRCVKKKHMRAQSPSDRLFYFGSQLDSRKTINGKQKLQMNSNEQGVSERVNVCNSHN